MKKIILTVAVVLASSMGAFAQEKGDAALGIQMTYGTEASNLGLGIKGQYNFADAIRGEASFDYFFEKDLMKQWALTANVHYLVPLTDKFTAYPLAGLAYHNFSANIPGAESEGRLGVNLGAGAQLNVTDNVFISAEAKYQLIKDFNQLAFSVGLGYKF